MFKKLHIQMTFFSTLITSLILITMTLICLWISESGIKRNDYTSYQKDISTMISTFENQSYISHEWLSQMESGGQYTIYLTDNGKPSFYETLKSDAFRKSIIMQAESALKAKHLVDLSTYAGSSSLTEQFGFNFKNEENIKYYGTAVVLPKNTGFLGILLIRSTEEAWNQIVFQRWIFLAAISGAIILLFIFSYFYTKKMIRPLKENRKKQTQFIASASHELRTPLAVILSNLDALKKADERESPQFTKAIETEGQRMSRLIDDLLLLASSDSDSWSMSFTDIEIDTLLLELYEKHLPVCREKNIRLSLELPEYPLPATSGDRQRLEQVFTILLDNAVSYTPPGGEVILSLTENNKEILIHFTDTGIGIPDEEKQQIWERFHRSAKEQGKRKHFGLGLSVAKEIIRLHGGSIWVEDNSGGGSVFIIKIPHA